MATTQTQEPDRYFDHGEEPGESFDQYAALRGQLAAGSQLWAQVLNLPREKRGIANEVATEEALSLTHHLRWAFYKLTGNALALSGLDQESNFRQAQAQGEHLVKVVTVAKELVIRENETMTKEVEAMITNGTEVDSVHIPGDFMAVCWALGQELHHAGVGLVADNIASDAVLVKEANFYGAVSANVLLFADNEATMPIQAVYREGRGDVINGIAYGLIRDGYFDIHSAATQAKK